MRAQRARSYPAPMKSVAKKPLAVALLLFSALVITLWSLSGYISSSWSKSTRKLCAVDVDQSLRVLALLEVSQEESTRHGLSAQRAYPRILCFAVSYSGQHETRVRAVAETWGQRCDKLLFFSNMSDTIVVAANTPGERRFEVVQLDIIADHDHLWLRIRAAFQYLYERFRHDYDWFYKCDDDTYVIMENLRAYLKRPEILERVNREPMQLGHRYSMPMDAFDRTIQDEALQLLWHSRYDRMVYNSGGSGYIINRLYLDKFVKSLPEWTCLSGTRSELVAEDFGIAFCMIWNDVYPWDTRDHQGRDRWHALNPHGIYYTYTDPNDWYVKYHNTLGGLRSRLESAAPDSVAFHYVNPPLMYHLERILYLCRSEHDSIASFNAEFGLGIGEKVMDV